MAAKGKRRPVVLMGSLIAIIFIATRGRNEQAAAAPLAAAAAEPEPAAAAAEPEPAAAAAESQAPASSSGGWAGSYLYQLADAELTSLADKLSVISPLTLCRGPLNFTLSPAEIEQLALVGAAPTDVTGQVLSGLALKLPCKAAGGGTAGTCCSHPVHFRRNTTDYKVFRQIFQCHYLRYLYPLFGDKPPKYILDAGGNVGFSTLLFKLLWPDATVVVLEPDSGNYAMLKRNTAGLKKVHALNAGLWGRSAHITMTGDHGNWGKIFREAEKGEEGMQAYSVQDVAKKVGIPAFDFVKIDIEGAEGMVFAPGSDFSWIQQARLVSLEVHDYFGGYFQLDSETQEISHRIEAAFDQSGYSIVSDNEHILYLAPSMAKALGDQQAPSDTEVEAATKAASRLGACGPSAS